MDKGGSMIIEAKKTEGKLEPKHEISLQCKNCGMEVDDVEYTAGTCSDCGEPWDEIRHLAIYVTSVPMSGKTM
jgi:protein-arginine kinase activator protein McsA